MSTWLKAQEIGFQPDCDLPPLADVVVIGGGVTGISVAYWLSYLRLRPVVLERGDLADSLRG